MKLSIITVNLNNRDGLQKTIDSVVSQTFKDYEWIVIDGGSTDGSKELIEQYADHFTYWVSEPDNGIYNAMNKGIRVAKGDYLQFLNSGDYLCDRTTLEKCLTSQDNADVIYGNLYLTDSGTSQLRTYPDKLTLRFFLNDTLCHNATFIKRDIIQQEYYNEHNKLVSDWEFFLSQAIKNKTFSHINEPVIYYDMQGISSSSQQIVEEERQQVIAKTYPQMLLEDYKHMAQLEAQLNNSQVKQVIIYQNKKKLYRKLITACLMLINFIDKHFWKNQ